MMPLGIKVFLLTLSYHPSVQLHVASHLVQPTQVVGSANFCTIDFVRVFSLVQVCVGTLVLRYWYHGLCQGSLFGYDCI
jgi:hypothetical protein